MRLPARLLGPCLLSSIALLTSAGCGSGGAGDGTDVGTSSSAVTSANNKTAFDYFVSKGLTDDQAARAIAAIARQKETMASLGAAFIAIDEARSTEERLLAIEPAKAA